MRAVNHYRLDGDDPSIVATGLTVFDLGVAKRVSRTVELNLSLDNLTNRDYFETQNYFESRVTPDAPVIARIHATVGGYALRYALEHPAVGRVTAIGRRKLGLSHPKLAEVLHRDFTDCSALAETLSGQDAAIFCLGAYTGAVPDVEFRKITVDYPIEFARVLHRSSPDAAFSFLSGSGADPTGRSRMAFARYKGEAEKALLAAGSARVYIFRPAYIYPVEPRKEPNFSYRLLRVIYPAFRVLFPNQVIPADDLARAMVDVAVRGTGKREGRVFENRDIRTIVESA